MARPRATKHGCSSGLRSACAAGVITSIVVFTDVAAAQHLTLAGDAARSATTSGALDAGPLGLAAPVWTFPDADPNISGPIRWVGEAGPVVFDGMVIAVSRQDAGGVPARMWAIDRATGQLVWSASLPEQVLDSWTTPTIDRVNRTVLYATGRPGVPGGVVQARSLDTGQLVWQTELELDVNNATVLVTADLGGRDRAFITDYQGFYTGGDGGSLYCINVDPYVAEADSDDFTPSNPYQPGEIVWRAPVQSGLSGATPAYAEGRVFIATAGDFDFVVGGGVLAFDARATDAADALLWETSVGGDDGFFGGVGVRNGAVYAATYDFFGGLDSSRLLKLDAHTGAVLWTAPANRTASIPITLGDDRVVLSTGLPGFGSVPTVQRFDDLGSSAALANDTATATWQDDGDGVFEPSEFDVFGGWSHQPHVVTEHPLTGGPVAFVGSIDTTGQLFGGYTQLSMIDLSASFGGPGWVIASFAGAGSSPAVVERSLYTVGPGGVYAFGEPFALDVNLDGEIDAEDLYAWHAGVANADVNRDGAVTAADEDTLRRHLRRYETDDMTGGRR